MSLEKTEWILHELQRIYDKSNDYNEVTLIKATQDIIREQAKRIEQMEGEIDGTIWSPNGGENKYVLENIINRKKWSCPKGFI